MFGWWWAGFFLLAGAGATAGVVALLPSHRIVSDRVEFDPLAPRMRLFVRASADQIAFAIARETGIALRREDAAYGRLYVAEASNTHLVLESRSEIGRSFEGEIRMTRRPSYTVVDYFILVVPDGGDSLLTAIQDFDQRLVQCLGRMDSELAVRYPRPERDGRMRADAAGSGVAAS